LISCVPGERGFKKIQKPSDTDCVELGGSPAPFPGANVKLKSGDAILSLFKFDIATPVRKLSQDVIPLAHCSNWNNKNDDVANIYYPIVAIKFGRGFLIHTGMSLDEEREYKTLIDSIRRLCLTGYKTLAGYV